MGVTHLGAFLPGTGDRFLAIIGALIRPRKVDSVLAVGISSSKPNNPKGKATHSKETRIKEIFLIVLSTKNKF